MHPQAVKLMKESLLRYKQHQANVLDVGSLDVNGNYRRMISSRGFSYTGIDITPGKNVDIVVEPYSYPFPSNYFDIVISGSTMEHVKDLHLWISEIVRVLKPGGLLSITTHTSWDYHPHPVDCWRIMQDGMIYLFDRTHQLEHYKIKLPNKTDIGATAIKSIRRK